MKRKRRCQTCKHVMKGHKKSRCEPQQTIELPDGCIYTGSVYDGQPFGRGRLVSDDVVYNGEFRNGKRHGHGVETHGDGDEYTGQWAQGLYHGPGQLKKSDMVYKGSFHTGTFHGYGLLEKNETSYDGHFCHGIYHGEGTLTHTGSVYQGSFYYGLKHGSGTMTEINGNMYSGHWHKDRRDGQGLYTTDDGTYTGNWSRDLQSGHGTWVSKCHGEYIGHWKGGQRHKKGQQRYKNGSVYTGGWSRGKKTGHGVQTWLDGTTYKGFWLCDEFHGRGILTESESSFEGNWVSCHREGDFIERKADGTVSEGRWTNDVRHGTFVEAGQRKLYVWGRAPNFKSTKMARSAAIRTLRRKDFLAAEAILQFYPRVITWTFIYKYDPHGMCLSIVPQDSVHTWLQKYAWTLFKKKRYAFLERLVARCAPGRLSYCEEVCTELYDQLTGNFVANPWIVHNVSYSEATRKKLLEGLHLGELGRCPPRNPFTRQALTNKSGQYLSSLPTKHARQIYTTFMEYVHRKAEIREIAYSFDLEDFEISLKNARDARDLSTIRRLMMERDAFIQQQHLVGDGSLCLSV